MLFSKFLKESKQVGIIYHFTRIDFFKKMVDEELLKQHGMETFEMISHNGVISFTRNPRLVEYVLGDISKREGYIIRLNVDGDKLSNKYKIRPIRGQKSNLSPFIKNDKGLVPREWEENEEMVIPKGTLKLRPYIKSITVSGDMEVFDYVKTHTNFPVNYERKFKQIKEGVDTIDTYELEVVLKEKRCH